jgi:spermidine synthase
VSRRLAAAVVFGASAAVLVLELLALRLLAPELGLTLETTTLVIGTVLAGIAAGAWAGGAAADRTDPRTLVGPLLVAGGLAAMATLVLVRVPLLGVLGFFAPAALLSAVTPVVAKVRLRDLSGAGGVVGSLSAWSTAGALAGTFVTGFVLLGALPNVPIVLGVGGALVVAGLVLGAAARTSVPAVLAGAVALGAAGATIGSRCEVETAYFCARVLADPARASGRLLVLDDLHHAYVDLADPRRLEFRYAQLIGRAVARLPEGPLRALHVGGGGFTLPRWLAATRPGSRSTVLEVDARVVALARERLGLRAGPALRVRTGDARLLVEDEPAGAYDVVVGDAFGGLAVPWHLTTREFVAQLRRVLRPGGLYAMNLIDRGPLAFARAEAATLAAAFRHVVVLGAPDGGNLVLLASDRPPPRPPLEPDEQARDGAAFARGADVLTDAHAPVDQLHTPAR